MTKKFMYIYFVLYFSDFFTVFLLLSETMWKNWFFFTSPFKKKIKLRRNSDDFFVNSFFPVHITQPNTLRSATHHTHKRLENVWSQLQVATKPVFMITNIFSPKIYKANYKKTLSNFILDLWPFLVVVKQSRKQCAK